MKTVYLDNVCGFTALGFWLQQPLHPVTGQMWSAPSTINHATWYREHIGNKLQKETWRNYSGLSWILCLCKILCTNFWVYSWWIDHRGWQLGRMPGGRESCQILLPMPTVSHFSRRSSTPWYTMPLSQGKRPGAWRLLLSAGRHPLLLAWRAEM